MIVTLVGDQGQRVDLTVPATNHSRSLYAFAPHKCGSVLLQNIVKDMCAEEGFPFLNIHSELFIKGLRLHPFAKAIQELLNKPGYCFGALRGPAAIDIQTIAPRAKIFLLRDPRDVIVSYYFSITKSHPSPGAGPARDALLANRSEVESLSIDAFVQRENGFLILQNIRTFLKWTKELPNSTLFRYEDIIFAKEAWVKAIAECFDFHLSIEAIKAIADRHDIIPEYENSSQHIRQVRPGNYKKHLSATSIATIESAFKDVLDELSY